jgi:hypothetical protein
MNDLTNIAVVTFNDDYSELWCNECAAGFEGQAGVTIERRHTWENNESDTPNHCPNCHVLLEQTLTDYGLDYVAEHVLEDLSEGNNIAVDPDSTVGEWHAAYGEEVKAHLVGSDSVTLDAILDYATVERHYLAAMLWTGTLDYMTNTHEFGGEPLVSDSTLDSVTSAEDLSTEIRQRATEDVTAFIDAIGEWLHYFPNWQDLTAEQLGHDFSLTRNHHGAGFWDRGYGELGQWLTRWAESFGSASLYGAIVLIDPASESLERSNLDMSTLQVWSD